MKTIFITILQGVEAKNILRTDIYRRLIAEPDLRLVLLVNSQEKKVFYEREFHHERASYEVLPICPASPSERFFSALKFKLIANETFDLRRRMRRDETGRYIAAAMDWLVNRLVARRAVRRIVRWLDYHIVRQSFLRPLFERHQPSAVFLAHLFDDLEVAILREALRRGIPSVGFINSWDKLTARAILRLLPGRLAVFNDIVRHEAEELADMPAEKIFVGGMPHYDCYVTHQPSRRESFCRALGADPSKRLVVYAPNGKYSAKADGVMIDFLHSAIAGGAIRYAELLGRFQPNHVVDRAEIEKRPWLIYDIPGIRFSPERGIDWDMGPADTQRLIDTLTHAAVLICYTSSLSVDAAACGKPVININFELEPIQKLSSSPIQYYHMTHYQKALSSGGIRVVSSPEELLAWINRYLENPGLDEAGRKRLVHEQCGRLEGRSGRRIAEYILAAL